MSSALGDSLFLLNIRPRVTSRKGVTIGSALHRDEQTSNSTQAPQWCTSTFLSWDSNAWHGTVSERGLETTSKFTPIETRLGEDND